MNYTLDFDQIKKDLMFLIKKYAGKYIPGSFYSKFKQYGEKKVNPTLNILITYRFPTLEEIASKLEIPPRIEHIGEHLLKKFRCFNLERFAAGNRFYVGSGNNCFIKENSHNEVMDFLFGQGEFTREDPTLDFYRMALQTFLRSADIEKNGLIAAPSPELQNSGFPKSNFAVIKQNLKSLREVLGDKDVYFFPYIFDPGDKDEAKKILEKMLHYAVILTDSRMTRDLKDLELGVAPLCLDLGDVNFMEKITAADIKSAHWIHTTPGYGYLCEIALLMKPARTYQGSHNEYHIGPSIQDGPGGDFGNSMRLFGTVDYNIKRWRHGFTLPRPNDVLVDYTSFCPLGRPVDVRLEILRQECLSGIAAIGLAGVFGTGYTRYLDIDGDGTWTRWQNEHTRLPEEIAGPIKQAIGAYYQEALQMPNPYTSCYYPSAKKDRPNVEEFVPEEGLPAIEL